MFRELIQRVLLGPVEDTTEKDEQKERLASLVRATNDRASLANALYNDLGNTVAAANKAQAHAVALQAAGDHDAADDEFSRAQHLVSRAKVVMAHADSAEVELIWLLPTVTPEYERAN